MSLVAVFSPIPLTPGMLSVLSPEALPAIDLADPLVLHRIENANAWGQKLEHILVTGDDDDVIARSLGLNGQGADQIISLIARLSHDGNIESLNDAMDVGNLSAHAFRHRRALRLVRLIGFMPQRRPGFIKSHRQAAGLVLADDLHQGGGEPVDGIGLQSLGVVERGQSEEGAVDIRASIYQVQRGPVERGRF